MTGRICYAKVPAVAFMGTSTLLPAHTVLALWGKLTVRSAVLNFRFSLRKDQNMHQLSTAGLVSPATPLPVENQC